MTKKEKKGVEGDERKTARKFDSKPEPENQWEFRMQTRGHSSFSPTHSLDIDFLFLLHLKRVETRVRGRR